MKKLFILLISAVIIPGCVPDTAEKKMTAADSLRAELLKLADSIDHIIEVKPLTYSAIPKGKFSLSSLKSEYGDSVTKVILSLNRIDAANLPRLDTLIVPDSIVNMIYYSPFPQAFQLVSGIPKLLLVSQNVQAFAAYEYGLQVKWGPVSTGKFSTPTPNGLFHTNWKAKETISTFDEEWLLKWSFNVDNFEGISLHQYSMPGYPASHACARMLENDAMWLYYWAQQWIVTPDEESILAYGTPVIIFGKYPFGARRPWKKLPEDPDANRISETFLNNLLVPYMTKIIKRQVERDSVIARRNMMRQQLEKQQKE